MDCIIRATTEEELIAIVPECVAYAGGRARFDFTETWWKSWDDITGGRPAPVGLWPDEGE